jgi:hypothetical protein
VSKERIGVGGSTLRRQAQALELWFERKELTMDTLVMFGVIMLAILLGGIVVYKKSE